MNFDIPDNCFAGCTALESVTLCEYFNQYKTQTKIGKNAFKGCRSLKTFTANSSITEIGSAAFLNCKKLTTFVINSRDTSHEQSTVGKKAFKGVKKLTLTYNEDNGYNAKSLARKIKKAGAKKVYYYADNLKRKNK